MPRRGAPPIPVRAWPEALKPWQDAAKREGLTLSAWVHRTLNREAGVADPRPHITGPRQPQTPDMGAHITKLEVAAGCPHPRDRRQRMPYGTICGLCGTLVGIGRTP